MKPTSDPSTESSNRGDYKDDRTAHSQCGFARVSCRISNDQIPFFMKEVLADDELKPMFLEEIRRAGVVTASGYNAVLRDFVRRERGANKLRGDETDNGSLDDNSADEVRTQSSVISTAERDQPIPANRSFVRGSSNGSQISAISMYSSRVDEKTGYYLSSRSPITKKMAHPFVGGESSSILNRLPLSPYTHDSPQSDKIKPSPSLTQKLSSAGLQESPPKQPSSAYIFESPRTEKCKPHTSLLQKLLASGLQESFSNLFTGASLRDELGPKKPMRPKKGNLAPRRNSQVTPFSEEDDETPCMCKKSPISFDGDSRGFLTRRKS